MMDAQRFIAEFGHIANAPGGIARLRELILHLAVSGDLIEASVRVSAMSLLESIEQRKADHLERKKVIPKQAPVPPGLIKAPAHWTICRLGDLALTITGGGTPSKSNPAYWGGQIPWASVKDLKDQKYIDSTEDYITESGLLNSSSNLIPPNRILICTRMGLGKIAINRVPLAINQDLKALELPPEVDHDFFLILYKTREVKGTGTTVTGIRQEQLLALPVVLPPIEEQSLIVAKVDELMVLCDRLEAQRKSCLQLQIALRRSTLQAVATATSPSGLRAAWTRLSRSFTHLFTEPDDVDDLVATVKSLAVRGMLASPSPNAVDLDKIQCVCMKTRDSYIESGLMRRQKPVGTATLETNYPAHWVVSAFDDVAIVIGGVTKGRDLRGQQTMTCPYLSVANVQRGHFKLRNMKAIEIAAGEFEKYKVEVGDLLVTEGGDWDKVGRTAIWEGGIENCLHQNHVFKARIPSELLSNEWVELVFNSNIGQAYFAGASKQTTNLASINMAQLRSFPLPIPPFDEQQTILETLAELTRQCNEWKDQLKRRRAVAALMATAAISSLTGIAIEPAEEPVRAPKTKLSAPLRAGRAPSLKEQAPLAAILGHMKDGLNAKELWQRYGGEIDAFYAQLKTEVANGWIHEPEPGVMNEVHDEALSV